MQEDKVAEINEYLVRHIPDVRVTNHYDFDREDAAVPGEAWPDGHPHPVRRRAAMIQHSRDELNQLLDKAIHHLRLTAPEVEVRVTERAW